MDEQEQDTGETADTSVPPERMTREQMIDALFASEKFQRIIDKNKSKILRSLKEKLVRAQKRLELAERFAQHGRQYRKNWHVL
jgi:hypothetical protein